MVASFSVFSVVGLVTFFLNKLPKTEPLLLFFSVGLGVTSSLSSFLSVATTSAGARKIHQ